MYKENVLLQPEQIELVDLEILEATQLFLGQVYSFTNIIPEVAQKKESIFEAGEKLIDTYDFGVGFFNSPARSLVFIALAEKYSKYSTSKEKSLSEKHIINSTLAFLTEGYENDTIRASRSVFKSNEVSKADARLQDEFTNQQLSNDLTRAIGEGMLDDVKQLLQIDSTNEEPYQVRVLRYTPKNGMLGLRPSNYISDGTISVRENIEGLAHRRELIKETLDYEKELVEDTREFSERRGGDLVNTNAFVVTINGIRQLCVPTPLALKLLHPELTELDNNYTEKDRLNDMAILRHEYTHTQGRIDLFPNIINIGIGLEELRADHFAGTPSYYDMFNLYTDLRLATGWNSKQLFDTLPKGGKPEDIYSSLAKNIGLNSMLELLLLSPNNYATLDGRKEAINNILGGYDGFIGRLLERCINNGDWPKIATRVDEYVDEKILADEKLPH